MFILPATGQMTVQTHSKSMKPYVRFNSLRLHS